MNTSQKQLVLNAICLALVYKVELFGKAKTCMYSTGITTCRFSHSAKLFTKGTCFAMSLISALLHVTLNPFSANTVQTGNSSFLYSQKCESPTLKLEPLKSLSLHEKLSTKNYIYAGLKYVNRAKTQIIVGKTQIDIKVISIRSRLSM